MMPIVDRLALAIADSPVASILTKATVIITLGLIGLRLAQKSRAAMRHAIIAAAFGVLFALPIASILAPPIRIAVPVTSQKQSVTIPLLGSAGLRASIGMHRSAQVIPSAAPRWTNISISALLLGLWSIGTIAFLFPVIVGFWQVRTLRRTALLWQRGQSLAARMAAQVGVRRRINALLHESTPGAMTCGVFRPAILLSSEAENWSEDDLHRAIAHELEHVRRNDWLTHCLARAVCAIYWFHPLVWVAWRKLTLEAECACDDGVLAGTEAMAYAEQLIALARRLSAVRKSPLLAMASRSDLAARINAVLDSRQRRGRAGVFGVGLAVIFAAALIITISPARLVAAQAGDQASGVALPSFEAASIKPHKHGDFPAFPQFLPGGRFTESGIPLLGVIAVAYNVPIQGTQVSGGPDWIRRGVDGAYDIDAKAEDGAMKGMSTAQQNQQVRLMLQALLADRFKLVIQREMKEEPVYILTVAKNGPKLQKSTLDPRACDDPKDFACDSGGGGQGRGLHFKAATVAQIVAFVNNFTDRPLFDRTGLTGLYDVDTTGWVPMREGPRPSGSQPSEAETLGDLSPPTLFGIFDGLGLKMEPSHEMVESYTVETVERPTPN